MHLVFTHLLMCYQISGLMKKLLCTTFCLIVIHANAQNVVRGPYLQILTQQSVEVCWRTDVPTDSKVEYGFGLLGQTFTQSTGAQTTEHRVTLTGLQPGTKYYYSVGSSAGMLAGGMSIFDSKPALRLTRLALPEFGQSVILERPIKVRLM